MPNPHHVFPFDPKQDICFVWWFGKGICYSRDSSKSFQTSSRVSPSAIKMWLQRRLSSNGIYIFTHSIDTITRYSQSVLSTFCMNGQKSESDASNQFVYDISTKTNLCLVKSASINRSIVKKGKRKTNGAWLFSHLNKITSSYDDLGLMEN